MRTHQSLELGDNIGGKAETVVVGQSLEQVLDSGVLAGGLSNLGDNDALLGRVERRGSEHARELLVLGEDTLEGLEGLVGGVKGVGLSGGNVLGECQND